MSKEDEERHSQHTHLQQPSLLQGQGGLFSTVRRLRRRTGLAQQDSTVHATMTGDHAHIKSPSALTHACTSPTPHKKSSSEDGSIQGGLSLSLASAPFCRLSPPSAAPTALRAPTDHDAEHHQTALTTWADRLQRNLSNHVGRPVMETLLSSQPALAVVPAQVRHARRSPRTPTHKTEQRLQPLSRRIISIYNIRVVNSSRQTVKRMLISLARPALRFQTA